MLYLLIHVVNFHSCITFEKYQYVQNEYIYHEYIFIDLVFLLLTFVFLFYMMCLQCVQATGTVHLEIFKQVRKLEV